MAELLDALAANQLEPVIAQRVPLAEAAKPTNSSNAAGTPASGADNRRLRQRLNLETHHNSYESSIGRRI